LGGQKLSGGDLPIKPFAREGAGFGGNGGSGLWGADSLNWTVRLGGTVGLLFARGVPGGETGIFLWISLERVCLVEGLGVDGKMEGISFCFFFGFIFDFSGVFLGDFGYVDDMDGLACCEVPGFEPELAC
jgi:hypothetical protein